MPLTELEEALLLVAGTGLTGLNLGDIDPSMGADAMVQWTARTWPSSCSNHGTELFFTNDDGLYFLDMWNLMPEDGEISTLQGKSRDAQVDWILELVRGRQEAALARPRRDADRPAGPVRLQPLEREQAGHDAVPAGLEHDPRVHQPAVHLLLARVPLHARGRDQRLRAVRAAERWIDSGRLDPARQMGIVELEQRVLSMQVVEQAFICQNINLALQAMGLGGWTYTGYIARFALGGHGRARASASASPRPSAARACRSAATGSSRPSRRPTTPTWARRSTPSSSASGRSTSPTSRRPTSSRTGSSRQIERPDDETIQIVKDYCQYVHDTYGRFPAYLDPMYQRLTGQAQHVDPDFYARYYPPGALTEQHHAHFERWHPELAGDDGRPPLGATG